MTLERVIAAPFRLMRKERLQRNDFIYFLALDRRWMSRDQAGMILERALQAGLLEDRDHWLYPKFDPSSIEIPLGYRPGAELFTPEEPYQVLLQRIASATKRPIQEVTAELNELIHTHFDGHLRAEAGVVILAKKYRVPYLDLLDRLKSAVTGG
ncbi:MAG: DUF2240 family protein [Methanomicrobiales archaeon]|nr:DUF2240 family protein [Methanomicrobiales archaeon]